MLEPVASRVVRKGRFRWGAWALLPGGPWFWISDSLTQWGARRELRRFIKRVTDA